MNGFAIIHDAVGAFSVHPAFELPPVKRRIPGTKRRKAFRRHLILQHRRRRNNFEHRPRRQLRLNRAVQQWMQRIFVQPLPLFFRNPHRKIVGVRRRPAHHRQHFAGARIQRHHRSRPRSQRLFRHLLQVVVDSQLNLLARNRFLRGQPPHFLTHAVHNHAPHPVRAHQQIVVLPFQSGLAREIAGPKSAVARFDLLFADFSHVSFGVSHESTGNISPPRNRNHFQYGDVRTVRLDERDIRVRSFRLDDNRLKFRQVSRGAQIVFQIFNRNPQPFGDARKILVHQHGIVAQQQNAE